MQATEQRALLTIALLAAFADGDKADTERAEIKRIADSLAGDSGMPQMAGLYQDVLLKRVNLAQAAAALPEAGHRQLAYEMALCVCDADGAQSTAEQAFLAQLKSVLKLGAAQTAHAEHEADAIAAVPVTPAGPVPAAVQSAANTEALDRSILQYAILNGALELLPQSWASMAIIPLQMKMVYRIGQAHGHTLDKGHIKEFIAAAGVGLTSQYLEQFGRKLLGGLLGKVGGGIGRSVGSAATGIAFSFASTYALGQLAKRYYGGGRQMNTAVLQQTFQSLLGPAKDLQQQYLPQIQQKAATLDAGQILQMVKSA
ncbi:DUF533 domain-containing protein [Aquincola tertiaricarbonis]|uniref:DUF533 domain-containing protein n=1 Tax=Aquincola tertiaricarbonis TaxID=391953 RepID=A0ABY4SFM4_AQUTE|nr:DUF533 domain-containing protein [Aquincola tertiaricarbonis]URI10935.1 DUF533 domain-containing protein [Aquincola tertiaricarbonis]